MSLPRRTTVARILRRVSAALLAIAAGTACAAGAPASVALFYGEAPPWDELAAFDWVVVEPDHVSGPPPAMGATEVFAYVSVGEVTPARRHFAELPAAWRAGENRDWGSVVIDQRPADWPAFLVDRIVRPLWAAGYRGFFLDTLDSYRIVATSATEIAEHQAGLVRAIRAVRAAFPDAKLFFNRGFEVLPELHGDVAAVAVESLFEGWDPREKRYRPVPAAERETLLGIVSRLRADHALPVVIIDYVDPRERTRARETAERIRALGYVPWVTNVEHTLLGPGAIEVMPRKVLMLHDAGRGADALAGEYVARYATLPLQWLGYVPEYRDITRDALPAQPLAGRYAGIVTWFYGDDEANAARIEPLVARARAEGVRIAVLGRFGVPMGPAVDAMFGTRTDRPSDEPGPVRVARRAAAVGFEIAPLPARRDFRPFASGGGDVWLQLADDRGATMDAVAITSWGGYAIAPHDMVFLAGGRGARWVVQPMEFLRSALGLPAMPVPDVTTESGRRLLVVRASSEGFAAPAESHRGGQPQARPQTAGEILVREVLETRRVPTSFAATAAPALAARALALPHVEAAERAPLARVDSAPTQADRSITLLGPVGLPRADRFEVFAPGASDDLYTNRWTGPYSGYARVLETFRLTETPTRLKPVFIDYHARSAARRASFAALVSVYDWAAGASLHPMYGSEYVARASAFGRVVVARSPDGFVVRGAGPLRQLRMPASAGFPDLAASRGLAGYAAANDDLYLHMAAPDAFVRMADSRREAAYIESANGRIVRHLPAADGFGAEIVAQVPVAFTIAGATSCEVREPGMTTAVVITRDAGDRATYGNGTGHGEHRATLVCRR